MRNRFFIERDSKNRRIMTNFGLTFRNSKWASFTQTNLSSKIPTWVKLSNTVTQFSILFIGFILLSYLSNLIKPNSYVFGSELLCSFLELIQTSICYSLTISLVIFSSIFNTVLHAILSKFFSVNTKTVDTLNNGKLYDNQLSNISYILHYKQVNVRGLQNTVEDLFGNKSYGSTLPFTSVYKIVSTAQLTDHTTFGKLNTSTPSGKFNTFTLLNNRWSFLSLQNDLISDEITQPTTLYNVTNNTFNNINVNVTSVPEYQTLVDLHSKYLQNIKIDRWLYRYSLLHRRSLHKAHDITLTKKLTSLGFFSGNLTSNNLWASNFVRFTPNLESTLTTLYTQTYGNIFTSVNQLKTPLSDLEFFESSYFWVLKRFYNLNTLSRNVVSSSVNLDKQTVNLTSQGDFKLLKTTDLVERLNVSELLIFSSLRQNVSGSVETHPFNLTLPLDVNCTPLQTQVLTGDYTTITRTLLNNKLTPNSSHLFFNFNKYRTLNCDNLTWDRSDVTLLPTSNLISLVLK